MLGTATSKRWQSTPFRRERIRLGELLAEYIRVARKSASEGEIPLASGWHWASDQAEELRPKPGAGTAAPAPLQLLTLAAMFAAASVAISARLSRQPKRGS